MTLLTGLTTASLTLTAAWPFAVVSDVVAAGIFSVVNTVLNGVILFMLSRTKKVAEAAAVSAEDAANLTAKVSRRTDSPRSPQRRRREEDPPRHFGID